MTNPTAMTEICSDKGKSYKAGRWFVLAVNFIFILTLYQWIMYFMSLRGGTTGWCMMEWLTNYEGGFIRRGLLGQLLYEAVKVTGIDPYIMILSVSLASFFFVGIFMIMQFRRFGIRWWLLAVLAYILMASIIRKDFIIYTLFIALLYTYRSRKSAAVRIAAMSMTSVLILMIYEPAIFMCLGLMVLVVIRDKQLPMWGRWVYPAVICATMLVLLKSTGEPGIGQRIFSSWVEVSPDIQAIPRHVMTSLDWSVGDSLDYNLSILMPEFHILSLLKYVFLIILTPYIYISYMYVDRYTPTSRFPYRPNVFTTVYLFFMLCMLPLWAGLSCDYGRLLCHATLSSLCVAFILPEKIALATLPKWSLDIGGAITGLFSRIPASVYSITLLMLIFMPEFSFQYMPDFEFNVNSLIMRAAGNIFKVFKMVLP